MNMKKLYKKRFIGVEVYDFKHCDYNFIGNVK